MKKKYIFLLVILLLCVFVTIILFIFNNNSHYDGIIVVDNDLCLNYENNKWKKIDLSNINWKKFKIYGFSDFIGNYYIVNNNQKFYFFDEEDNSYDVSSPYIGIQDGSNIKIINFKENTDYSNEDISNIKNYLSKNKINYDGEYSFYKKYIVDVNNDQINDIIYLLSNQLYTDNYFYIIFTKINNDYITINFQDDYSDIINYNLAWVINTKNHKYRDLIFSYYDFDQPKYDLFVFNAKKKVYKAIKY